MNENKGKFISIFIVLVFVVFLTLVIMDGFDNEFSRLRYCNTIGFDGYAYDCKDMLCINEDYYCITVYKNDSMILFEDRQDIEDDIDDNCWFFCEINKLEKGLIGAGEKRR